MISHPLFVLAVLAANVAASEWLARHTWLRHLGSALLVIVLTSIAANAGLIPTYSNDVALYVGVFDYLSEKNDWLYVGSSVAVAVLKKRRRPSDVRRRRCKDC